MPRLHKFRVWKIPYDDDIKPSMTYSDEYGPKGLHEFFTMHDVYPHNVLMYWTALIDINGKDIYEGDILEHAAYRDIVVLRNCVFTLKINKFDQSLITLDVRHSLVIGNIYENPY